MASRDGKMVEGTDGTDHLFRERVASQDSKFKHFKYINTYFINKI